LVWKMFISKLMANKILIGLLETARQF